MTALEKKDHVEISSCFFSWKEAGIINVHFKANQVISPLEQDEMLSAHQQFTKNTPHAVLYTADDFVTFTPEARKRSKELEQKVNHLASASISHNMAYTILANFYIKFNKPAKPFRNFRKESDALEWLRTFLKKK